MPWPTRPQPPPKVAKPAAVPSGSSSQWKSSPATRPPRDVVRWCDVAGRWATRCLQESAPFAGYGGIRQVAVDPCSHSSCSPVGHPGTRTPPVVDPSTAHGEMSSADRPAPGRPCNCAFNTGMTLRETSSAHHRHTAVHIGEPIHRPHHENAPATRRGDAAALFRAWLRHPLRTAAIAPSSAALTRLMTKDVAASDRVVELGPGTGVFTDSWQLTDRPGDRCRRQRPAAVVHACRCGRRSTRNGGIGTATTGTFPSVHLRTDQSRPSESACSTPLTRDTDRLDATQSSASFGVPDRTPLREPRAFAKCSCCIGINSPSHDSAIPSSGRQ